MDRAVIDRKMESIRRCITRIATRTPATAEQLAKDLDSQDIITVNLERAVQSAVDLASQILSELEAPPPETLSASFEALRVASIISDHVAERMKKAVGFRNIAVHEYENINWAIVHAIAAKHLEDFKSFLREIDRWVANK